MIFLKNNFARFVREMEGRARQALPRVATAVLNDLRRSGTMPFDTGHLQNAATYVDVGNVAEGQVAIVSDTVYARRKFFHPEFNFDQSRNSRAGGRWFDAYIDGDKKDFAAQTFARLMR